MSGIGEERWRNSRGQQPSSQGPGNQQRKPNAPRKQNSINQPPGKPTGESQDGAKPMSPGNAWGAERGWTEGAKSPVEQQPAATAFKAPETRDFLKQGYSGEDAKAARYKAPSVPATTKAGGPWGSKPNTMGNGKDFFVELRKQISTLQNNERPGG